MVQGAGAGFVISSLFPCKSKNDRPFIKAVILYRLLNIQSQAIIPLTTGWNSLAVLRNLNLKAVRVQHIKEPQMRIG